MIRKMEIVFKDGTRKELYNITSIMGYEEGIHQLDIIHGRSEVENVELDKVDHWNLY